MLWGVWSQVPDGVKEMLHQSMSQWFVVPEEGRDWADKTHRERFKEWKHDLRLHWKQYGSDRSGTPKEFEYREYEWRWLLVTQFNDPHKQVCLTGSQDHKLTTLLGEGVDRGSPP
ncbi:hypothetical protein ACLB2K_045471 [Fragaria x ananassa]